MRERPNRTVSKTVVLKGTVGSNPPLSATPAATPQNSAGGIRTEVLKGVCPLRWVTGAKRRREGAWPLSGSACEAPKRDFEFPPSPPYKACSTRSLSNRSGRRDNYIQFIPSIPVSAPTEVLGAPPPPVVCPSPQFQATLCFTQEGRMFEQSDAALVMTLLALGGISLMADESIGTTCMQMVKWLRTRSRR